MLAVMAHTFDPNTQETEKACLEKPKKKKREGKIGGKEERAVLGAHTEVGLARTDRGSACKSGDKERQTQWRTPVLPALGRLR